jgi:hypothetical protein
MTAGSPQTARDAEAYADRLLGRMVRTRNNRPVGRIEELRANADDDWTVTKFVLGAAGLLERLGVAVRLVLGRRLNGYVARWDQIDLSDPEHPRLTCAVEELEKI